MTKSSYGNAIVISVTRETTVSTQPRKKPAIEPSRTRSRSSRRREHGDLERDLGAVEQAEELVAAERAVGAEDVEGRVAGGVCRPRASTGRPAAPLVDAVEDGRSARARGMLRRSERRRTRRR